MVCEAESLGSRQIAQSEAEIFSVDLTYSIIPIIYTSKASRAIMAYVLDMDVKCKEM
jgi:hypothetical protein